MKNTQLGSWLIEKELARGEIGTIYLASRPTSAKSAPTQAAIKLLHAEADATQRYRLLREIDVLDQLDNLHIVRLFESGLHEGRPYYVMEYVDASDLSKVVERQGRISWSQAVEVMQQVCVALKYCHDRGIVHGNIKLSHLLCGTTHSLSGTKPLVKVIDFGLAWVFGGAQPGPPRSYAGNPGEMSPEQLDGKPATPRSDVFALGAVLWSLVTGKRFASFVDPWADERYARVPPATTLTSSLPEALDQLLNDALAVDPAARPSDASVFLRRLDSVARLGERRAPAAKQVTAKPRVQEAADPDETPAEVMSRLMREELERQRAGNTLNRFINKPVVLVVLLLITLGLIIWGFMPPSAESLYRKGSELMQSDDPRDWETAWSEYLEPLQARYPQHPHQDEVKEYRRRVEEYRGQKEVGRLARQAGPMSEAHWFYLLGLRQRQRGEEDKAQQTWRLLIELFRDVPVEQPWVKKAEQDLTEPQNHKLTDDQRWMPIRTAIGRIHQLEQAGKHDEAKKLRATLKAIYADDPSARALLQQAGALP